MFSAPGPLELAVILIIALIVLGPKRLPDAARQVGRGVRELREAMSAPDFGSYERDDEEDDEDENDLDDRFEPDDDEEPKAVEKPPVETPTGEKPASEPAPAGEPEPTGEAEPTRRRSTADHS
jgi:sec-independent protein translocase protein TatA